MAILFVLSKLPYRLERPMRRARPSHCYVFKDRRRRLYVLKEAPPTASIPDPVATLPIPIIVDVSGHATEISGDTDPPEWLPGVLRMMLGGLTGQLPQLAHEFSTIDDLHRFAKLL